MFYSTRLYKSQLYWKRIFSILFSFRKKVYVVSHPLPLHPNLGDQAQLMCTDKWLNENYSDYKVIHLGILGSTLNFDPLLHTLLNAMSAMLTITVMKLKARHDDIFIGHSGYFFIDHHTGYKAFMDMMHYFPHNKMIILPQTINFHTPMVKQHVSREFAKAKNVILLCRDRVSYDIAKEMFPTTSLLLYPDIVTSLIGTRHYNNKRNGVLFCMRNDIEAFYKPEQIEVLMSQFGNIREDIVDTTLKGISNKQMAKRRDQLINEMIEKISTYRCVITDRYHGTIFSAIASTPVIVISSADHKLSSGVNWFPNDVYDGYIYYAKDLSEAYTLAQQILNRTDYEYNNPPYFKNNYWDVLPQRLANLKYPI